MTASSLSLCFFCVYSKSSKAPSSCSCTVLFASDFILKLELEFSICLTSPFFFFFLNKINLFYRTVNSSRLFPIYKLTFLLAVHRFPLLFLSRDTEEKSANN